MKWGISGKPIPAALRYAAPIQEAADDDDFPPLFAYAIAWRETISGEVNGLWPSAATVVSGDAGHGLFQLTSSYPGDWQDPKANALYAIQNFLLPAQEYWYGLNGYTGPDLVKLCAAEFNAGRGNAERGHEEGNVDLYTTDNYGTGVLAIYQSLVTKGVPA